MSCSVGDHSPLDQESVRSLIDSIGAKTPTPGGGAVAAITAALAAALSQMVVNYSIGKKSLAAHQSLHESTLQRLQSLASTSLALADADAAAYAHMNRLWRLDENDPERKRELPSAILGAIEPPRQMLIASLEILNLLTQIKTTINPHMKSDLAIAAILAEAAARSAAWNININLPLLSDGNQRTEFTATTTEQLSKSKSLLAEIDSACHTA